MSTCSTFAQRDGKQCLQRWECVSQDMGQTRMDQKILQLSKTTCHLNCILSRLIDDSHIQSQAHTSLSSCTEPVTCIFKAVFQYIHFIIDSIFLGLILFYPFLSNLVLATILI